jgi:hypothetical protein
MMISLSVPRIIPTSFTVTSSALAVALTLSVGVIPLASAILYGEDSIPTGLTGDEFIVVRDTALSDPKVQQLIDGRNYSITDCCGFYRESPTSPWQPVINIRVANELQIGVGVDLDERRVISIETGPALQFQVADSDGIDNSFTTGVSSRMPIILALILTIVGILGGAAAGIFYFAKKGKKGLDTQGSKS